MLGMKVKEPINMKNTSFALLLPVFSKRVFGRSGLLIISMRCGTNIFTDGCMPAPAKINLDCEDSWWVWCLRSPQIKKRDMPH